MARTSGTVLLLGVVSGLAAGGCEKSERAAKKLELERQTLRRLDAGVPDAPAAMRPNTPPTNQRPRDYDADR